MSKNRNYDHNPSRTGLGLPSPALMQLCGHDECYTRIDGILYMLNGCMKVKYHKSNGKCINCNYITRNCICNTLFGCDHSQCKNSGICLLKI